MTGKNVLALQSISMTMRIRRYGAEHIAQYSRSSVVLLFVVPERICVPNLVVFV